MHMVINFTLILQLNHSYDRFESKNKFFALIVSVFDGPVTVFSAIDVFSCKLGYSEIVIFV